MSLSHRFAYWNLQKEYYKLTSSAVLMYYLCLPIANSSTCETQTIFFYDQFLYMMAFVII